jgi:hypothetical protein
MRKEPEPPAENKKRGGPFPKRATAAKQSAPNDVGIDNPFQTGEQIPEAPVSVAKKTKKDKTGKKLWPWQKEKAVAEEIPVPEKEEPAGVAPIVFGDVQPLPEVVKARNSAGNGGYTVSFGSMDSGIQTGTVLMQEGMGDSQGAAPTLWLVARADGQRVQITHSNFHVGRMLGRDEIVDYAVLTTTGFLGADHAYFQIKDGVFYLTDNNSKNGTWLNGNRLTPSCPYPVQGGDVVKMADITFDLQER